MAAARDRILLPRLQFTARVGVLPGEADQPQPLAAELELWLELEEAARSDRLEHSFDYRRVPEILDAALRAGPCGLLEHLAARIVEGCLADPRVQRVRVRLSKVRPPLGADFGTVAVELDRTREQQGSP